VLSSSSQQRSPIEYCYVVVAVAKDAATAQLYCPVKPCDKEGSAAIESDAATEESKQKSWELGTKNVKGWNLPFCVSYMFDTEDEANTWLSGERGKALKMHFLAVMLVRAIK
jgi:hypothetical protein